MTVPSRIALVGFMAAGKTTVGRLLAARLGYAFCDLDENVEASTGLPVAEIFRRHGEGFFRAAEQRAATAAVAKDRVVIATGGGAFVQPHTRDALRMATTVWLSCSLEAVESRLRGDRERPLASTRETIHELFAERESAYGLADLKVDTTAAEPSVVVQAIVDALTAAAVQARTLGEE